MRNPQRKPRYWAGISDSAGYAGFSGRRTNNFKEVCIDIKGESRERPEKPAKPENPHVDFGWLTEGEVTGSHGKRIRFARAQGRCVFEISPPRRGFQMNTASTTTRREDRLWGLT